MAVSIIADDATRNNGEVRHVDSVTRKITTL
jgi:hypothetical protein